MPYEPLPVGMRLALETDFEYVVKTWEKHCPHPGQTSKRFIEDVLEPILEREETVVRVAHDLVEEDAIVGFAVLELGAGPVPPLLLHVYVRKAARRRGVASGLLADLQGPVDVAVRPPFPLPNRFRFNPNRWPST